MSVPTPRRYVFPDPDKLAMAAAERWVELCHQAIARRGAFHVALAGGGTPRALYRRLAGAGVANRVPWADVHAWFGDERSVPQDHADSNYRMAREALLDHVPIPPSQIHPITARPDHIQDDADAYQALLATSLPLNEHGVPRFDLVLLGMGDDGHTASLFPGTAILGEYGRLVAPVYVTRLDTWRISLTFPVLNAASHLVFLVAGEAKAPVIGRVFAVDAGDPPLPVQQIDPAGLVEWFLDDAAAAGLGD